MDKLFSSFSARALLILLCSSASAQTLHVLSLDPNFDAKAMVGKLGIVDRKPTQAVDVMQPMDVQDREALLDESKLKKDLKGWDDLDQDLFILHARHWRRIGRIKHIFL